MKKLLSLAVSLAIVLSSFLIFDITGLGSENVSIDDFSAALGDMITEYGVTEEHETPENPRLNNAAVSSAGEFETRRIIVKSENPVDPLNAAAVVSGFENIQILQFETAEDAENAYEYYLTLDGIEFAEPDRTVTVSDTSEEEYPYETKTSYLSWGPEYIGFDELNNYIVENKMNLAPVKVAVIDTGINHARKELAGRIEDTYYNNSGSGESDSTADEHGHGTHVASTIVDCTFSNVIIRPYKVFNSEGKSSNALIATALYKVSEDGCDIVNMSFSQLDENHMVKSAIDYIKEKTDPVLIAAMGNEGTNLPEMMPMPAISEHVIAVSAITKAGELADFSNYSKEYVELTAPGDKIKGPNKSSASFSVMSGTSMAAPFVSAVAAAAKSVYPSCTTEEIRALLNETAVPLAADRQNRGYFGSGLVYAMGALQIDPSIERAEAPVFSREAGKYENSVEIELSAQEGARIYYTTDGTIPDESSTLYDGKPITVENETHILAAAYIDGAAKSPVSAATYRIVETVSSDLLTVDDNGYITAFSGDYSDISVPETAVSVSGKTVTVIGVGENAFENNLYLKSVQLPDTVKYFENGAFYGCENLEEINIANAVSIGDGAFYLCRVLKNISIPNAESIGSYAFYEAGSLTGKSFSLSLPKLSAIGEYAFYSTNITHFYAPNAVSAAGNSVFENCAELIEVYFPGATDIGSNAFANCSKLTSVAFDNAASVGDGAFLNCSAMESLSLESAQSLGDKAIHGCSLLAVFSLPSVRTLYLDSFKDIPESVTELVLPSLETINEVEGAKMPANLVSFTAPKLKNIPAYSFEGNAALTGITLGSVETVGEYAFSECSALAEIDLSSAKTIGAYAFYRCSKLTEVDLSSLETLGEYAFNNCSKLQVFDMPEVKEIGAFSFFGTNLKYLSAPKATKIAQRAFANLGNITAIKIDLSSLKSITYYNFFTGINAHFILSSLETGDFSASGSVFLSDAYGGTASAYKRTAPYILNTADGYGYSYMPESASVPETLFVSANGINLTYQWYSNSEASRTGSTAIEGATSPELDLLTVPDAPYYYCKVMMNNSGTTSTAFSTFVKNNSYLNGAKRADYSAFVSAIDAVPEDMSNYTAETVNRVNSLVDSVNYNLDSSSQSAVDSLAASIAQATEALTLKPADYSAVEAELAKVPEDLSLYTHESAAAVEYAVQSMVYDLSITAQPRVDCMAALLADKLSRLELGSADYSELEALIASLPELDAYTDDSVAALQAVLDGIDYSLKSTEQEKVDGYIEALEKAVSELVLRAENYPELRNLMDSVPEDLTVYTDESVSALNKILEDIESNLNSADSGQIDEYIEALGNAISSLEMKSADYSELNAALETVPTDLSIYTDESVAALNEALSSIDKELDITDQAKVEEYVTAINNAVANLELKPADYSELNAALETVPTDLSIYTDESVAALNEVLSGIDKGLDITDQAKVDEYVTAIIEVVTALELKPADYSKLNAALETVPTNLSIYTDESVAALYEVLSGIDKELDITDQAKVDEYVTAIIEVVTALELKPADYSELDATLETVPDDLSVYTDESVAALYEVLSGIDKGLDITDQAKVDEYVTAVNEAVTALELKPADYSKLDAALETVPTDLSIYTDESVAALNEVLNSIDKNLDVTEQAEIEAYIAAVNRAVSGLQIKKADLAALNSALTAVPTDLSIYTEESVAALEEVLDGIDHELAEVNQEYADECADAVREAVENLEEEHWVIRLIKAIIRFFRNLFSF